MGLGRRCWPRQPRAARRSPRLPGSVSRIVVGLARAVPAPGRRRDRVAPDQGHRAHRGRPAGQGRGREHHDRRPGAQRPRHVCRTGSVEVPELLRGRGAPRVWSTWSRRSRGGCGRARAGRSCWRRLPAGVGHGCAQEQRADGYRRARAGAARPLLRCVRLGRCRRAVAAALAVAIRTFWLERDGVLSFGTGAGITWGSDAEAGVARDRAEGRPPGRAGLAARRCAAREHVESEGH